MLEKIVEKEFVILDNEKIATETKKLKYKVIQLEDRDEEILPYNCINSEKKLKDKKGFVQKWTGNEFEYVEDNRGTTVYDTETKQNIVVSYVGKLQENHVTEQPKRFQKWNKKQKKWEYDETAKAQIIDEMILKDKMKRNEAMKEPVQIKGYNIKIYDEVEQHQPMKDLEPFIFRANMGQKFTQTWFADKIEKTGNPAIDYSVELNEEDFKLILPQLQTRREKSVAGTYKLWMKASAEKDIEKLTTEADDEHTHDIAKANGGRIRI